MTEVLPSMGHVSVSPSSLRSSASQNSFFDLRRGFPSPRKNNYSFDDVREPSVDSSSQSSSNHSTSASSLSLETSFDDSGSDDDALAFPSYANSTKPAGVAASEAPPSSPVAPSTAPSPSDVSTLVSTPEALPISEDDTAVRPEPSQHVDYLSHEWKEEDIWSSWRHIVVHRRVYGERSRLENASWRTWAKQQFKLKTTSPESLNWYVSSCATTATTACRHVSVENDVEN
jgi:hypothetical protein